MAQNNYYKNTDPDATDFGLLVRLIPGTAAFPVTISTAITVNTKTTPAANNAVTNPAATGANQTLLAANANRLGGTIYFAGGAGTTLTVKLGATASATSYTIIMANGGYYEIPFGYVGQIDAIASAATGNISVNELTA